MGARHNQKNYTYSRRSFRICDFSRFGGYAFRLKTLSLSQHSEWEVTN